MRLEKGRGTEREREGGDENAKERGKRVFLSSPLTRS